MDEPAVYAKALEVKRDAAGKALWARIRGFHYNDWYEIAWKSENRKLKELSRTSSKQGTGYNEVPTPLYTQMRKMAYGILLSKSNRPA